MQVDLKVGQVISNSELSKLFTVAPQGGMRRSKKKPNSPAGKKDCLVLVSKLLDNPYPDEWQGDVLHYSGMGQEGDQSIERAQNKTLNESGTNGVPVFLFIHKAANQYAYQGPVKLVGKPYYKVGLDKNNHERQVAVFPIKVIID